MSKFPAKAGFLIALLVFSIGGSLLGLQKGYSQSTHDGEIEVTPEQAGPSTNLTILIIDEDLDQNSASTDHYSDEESLVSIKTDRNEVGEAFPDIEETGPGTGVFMLELQLVTDFDACMNDDLGDPQFAATGGSEPSIGVCPGDLISIRYEDSEAEDGSPSTVSYILEVQTWDPEFSPDQITYDVGDTVTISIQDIDANFDPDIADSITDIRVFSTSDAVGEEFVALETGKNTGIFRLFFELTGSVAAGKILANDGDSVTIEFIDEFPSDFDEVGAKEVTYGIFVGTQPQFVVVNTDRSSYRTLDNIEITGSVGMIASSVTTDAVDIDSIVLQDVDRNEIEYLILNHQMIIAVELTNNNAVAQPFACIVEVRDSQGITVYRAWQTGTMSPNGQISVGVSWMLQTIDRYQVRAFVVGDLSDMQPLSKIALYDTATRDFSILDVGQGQQPLVLKISSPTDELVIFDQVRVKPDRSFEYTARLGGMAASQSGSYEILAAYDGTSKSKSITFVASEQTLWDMEAGGQTYQIKTVSTSGVDRVTFFEDEGRLQVSLSGDPNIPGILYIIFPSIMMDHIYEVNLDDQKELKFDDLSNPLYTIIKTQYSHSNHDINTLGHVPIPAKTNSVYSVKYLWSPCTPENASDCNVHKDSHTAILELYFAYHDGTPATTVAYSGNIDNSRITIPARERNMMQEGESIERVSLDGLSPLRSIPQPYDGVITITKIDGRDERVTAEIAVSVIPEFPVVLPMVAVVMAILIVFARFSPKIWKL